MWAVNSQKVVGSWRVIRGHMLSRSSILSMVHKNLPKGGSFDVHP